jgi:molybdopterin synthase sulfur carrier subunit
MALVRLDAWLGEFGAPRETEAKASDVEGLLMDLESRYPRLRYRLRDEAGAVRRFVRIFVDGRDILQSEGLRTPLGAHAVVDILHSIAGG